MKNLVKRIRQDRRTLTNLENIWITLGGTAKDLEVATKLLAKANQDLNTLYRFTAVQLDTVQGMTPLRAARFLASAEMGLRRQDTPKIRGSVIASSNDAFNVVRSTLSDLNHEEFHIVLLSRRNSVIETWRLSVGGSSSTIVDVKLIFSKVLSVPTCTSIILAHNHPSQNLKPSKADIAITTRIKKAGEVLDIAVLDHIVVGGNEYTSLADEGLM